MPKRIAVVDDDRDILTVIQLALEDAGYQVEVSTDGAYLRQLTPKNMPDLVLLDVQLSGEDGRALCRYVKSNELTRHIPVILISAATRVSEIRREGSANDFLAKPFELGTLIRTVQRNLPM
ncbi:MAG TPA: response regulator [Ktedonobacteraceae bacterium]|nr:response regulator [Ktedonobacteraceae bacterium]